MKLSRLIVLGLAVVFLQSQAFAQITFTANITHDQEPTTGGNPLLTSTGQPRPLSFGTATFSLNASMTSLTFLATIFNIDVTGTQTADNFDNLANAHIHAGAASGQPGTNASVVWGFFGTPFNDNNPNDFSLVPFSTGVGGTFSGKWDLTEGNGTTLAAQLPNIFAGRSYINFHTTQFTGGEIRGQILPTPETASTGVLLALAFAGMIGIRARQRPVRS